ncbi:MAG TPA: hypothetical protein VJX16_11340 [Terriglobales bacterium]|nr:hypothetical protein [Terriglobales bacterium]
MTKTYFRLIEVSAEERPERVAPAFASLAAAQKYRADILKDPEGLRFSIVETDEQGKPKSANQPTGLKGNKS